jgi:hypothetical protein
MVASVPKPQRLLEDRGQFAYTKANPSPQSSLKARIEEHCPVCEHPEKPVADRALGVAQSSPRSIKRRYCDLSRKALARHRDVCLASSRAEDAA